MLETQWDILGEDIQKKKLELFDIIEVGLKEAKEGRMILDANGQEIISCPLKRAVRDAERKMAMKLARAIYGDGGPMIVHPDWKPDREKEIVGLQKALEKERVG